MKVLHKQQLDPEGTPDNIAIVELGDIISLRCCYAGKQDMVVKAIFRTTRDGDQEIPLSVYAIWLSKDRLLQQATIDLFTADIYDEGASAAEGAPKHGIWKDGGDILRWANAKGLVVL